MAACCERSPGSDNDAARTDVLLHSDQGVYLPSGGQLPFRRGQRSYVLVGWRRLRRLGMRLVILDTRFRCSSATVAQLLRDGMLTDGPDGRGYVLTAQGLARARK